MNYPKKYRLWDNEKKEFLYYDFYESNNPRFWEIASANMAIQPDQCLCRYNTNIYENDIVYVVTSENGKTYKGIGKVEYCSNRARFEISKRVSFGWEYILINDYSVLELKGNIYTNKDLLEIINED